MPDTFESPELAAATVAKMLAEAAKFEAEAADFQARAERSQIITAQERRIEAFNLASDFQEGIYRLQGEITYTSCEQARDSLTRMARMNGPGKNLTLVMNSNGGSVYAGMDLYDELSHLTNHGHTLTTISRGWTASMAAILMQAGTNRVIGAQSIMLLHEPSTILGGTASEIADAQAEMDALNERVLTIFADRAARTGRDGVFTRTQIKNRIKRKNWTLSAQEAFDGGLVDEID